MARRRFQDPKPKREGNWWYLRIRQDVFAGGAKSRKLQRLKIAPASMPEREVRKNRHRDVATYEPGTHRGGQCSELQRIRANDFYSDRTAAAGKDHAEIVSRHNREMPRAEIQVFLSARSHAASPCSDIFQDSPARELGTLRF